MKPRNLLIIFAVFVVVVAFYFVFEKIYMPKHEAQKENEDKVFTLEQEDLDTIKITTESANIVMTKTKDSERWIMTAPFETETDAGEIESFIASALDVKIMKNLGTKTELADKLGEFGLENPRIIVVLGSGDKSEALLLGNTVAAGGAVYAMKKGDDRIFLLDETALSDLNKDTTTLRNKSIVPFAADDIKKISVTRDNKTVTVMKDASGSWMITEPFPYQADQDQINEILKFLADATATSFAEDTTKKNDYGLEKPAITCVLTNVDGATARLFIGSPAGDDGFWAMREGKPWIFTVSKDVKNNLTISPDFIMNRSLFSYTVSNVTAFEAKTKDSEFSVARDEKGWKVTKPEAVKGDRNSINTLLLDLKEARFTKIVEQPAKSQAKYGLANPALTYTITYKDGDQNRTAELKIAFSKGDVTYGYLSEGDFIFTMSTEDIQKLVPSFFMLKDKSLISFAPDSAANVTVVFGDETYVFTKKKDDWKMTKPKREKVDAEAMKDLLLGIGDLSYSAILVENKDSLKQWGLDPADVTITITDKANKEIGVLKFGKEKEIGDESEKARYRSAVSTLHNGVYRVNADLVTDVKNDLETIREGR